jgi:hypothetical protein
VDNIVAIDRGKRFFIVTQFLRDHRFGDVLFHEIGHHIHATIKPEHREKEDVADVWGKKLRTNFAREKYWYLIRVAKPLAWSIRAWSRLRKG